MWRERATVSRSDSLSCGSVTFRPVVKEIPQFALHDSRYYAAAYIGRAGLHAFAIHQLLLRLAGSLKLGMVQATSIMKTLRIDDRPTKLAQAVAELGRIDKTIHALTYIADENKRRRTLTQLMTTG